MKLFYFSSMASKIKASKLWRKTTFIIMGIAASAWFLIRVIPKPSRAGYPCMKAAAPFMSSFVIYLLSITGSAFAFKKFRQKIVAAKYISATAFFVAMGIMFAFTDISQSKKASAMKLVSDNYFVANNPMGVAQGSAPGRVVWVWNPEATDENFTPANDEWWINHTNLDVVEEMLYNGLTAYTNKSTAPEAWDVIFKYFNYKHGKGEVGYKPGEKIYIKINLTNSCCMMSGTRKNGNFDRMDSTPEVILALLRQLIEEVGVAQEDIYLGDPFRTFRDEYWDFLTPIYPNVVYCDGKGSNGRHQTVPTDDHAMFFSDGKLQYRIPSEYYDAEYFINLPALKSHDSGGITLGAKNHQGSILQDGVSSDSQSAFDMHYSLPDHDDSDGGPHRYRHLVDYLAHERLGGNTLITIIDGIWAGRSWEGFVEKWEMAPFNGDYPSSLFLSQDRVAIDAVCYDFLLEEYKNKTSKQKYPYMEGTDDFLKQAADPANWPAGVVYDPENDGTPISSLGVYEHWNNPTDKQYSRDLGTGNGIELVKVLSASVANVLTKENSDLPSNEVKSIYIDDKDVAWIGTDAGLARHDGINWNIYNTENYLPENAVNDIAFDQTSAGNVLLIATNSGLTVANVITDGIANANTFTEDNSDMVGSKVVSVMVDSDHNRWIATEKAVNVMHNGTWASKTTGDDSMGEEFNLSSTTISDIAEYKPKSMAFVSTKGQGILRIGYNEVDGFTGASTLGPPWASMTSNKVSSISINGDEQWYGSDAGVFHHPEWATKSDWIIYTKEDHHLLDNNITAVHVDAQANIWVGTTEGLNIIKEDGTYNKYSEQYGLVNNHINVITSDSKGNVWVGTSGGVEWFESIPGVDVKTAVESHIVADKVKVYPNPATSIVNLDISIDRPQFVRVAVYNLNGQLVDIPIEEKISNSKSTHQINISNRVNYKQGIYIVRIDCEDYTQISKLQVN